MTFTNKQKCTTCIHKEVCSIYEYAKKYIKESTVKFKPSSMADVCHKYLKDIHEHTKRWNHKELEKTYKTIAVMMCSGNYYNSMFYSILYAELC